LKTMLDNCFPSQRKVFRGIINEMKFNSVSFVSGAAGTGKSYLLKMLGRFYCCYGYRVINLAPTGVTAYNISGETILIFFGMSNGEELVNMQCLEEHIKLYLKTVLLIDEYSMISNSLLEDMQTGFIKVTCRSNPVGSVKTPIFFRDFAQLPHIIKGATAKKAHEELLWQPSIYKRAARFTLVDPIRQRNPESVRILELVRTGCINREVIDFMMFHIRVKGDLPLIFLRLYPESFTCDNVNIFSEDYFPGDNH
jgi:hypothetical protein